MDALKSKKHRHDYEKITQWITKPNSPDEKYAVFQVMRACECGVTQRGYSEVDDVEEFIKNHTCLGCGFTGSKHDSQSDCIHDLQLRVKYLEDRLNQVCDALSGIRR